MSSSSPGRRVASFGELELAGDYFLGTISEGGTEVAGTGVVKRSLRFLWFLLPTHTGVDRYDRPDRSSGIHGITEPPWRFRECADGSVEARESIACGRHEAGGEYWHGYLDEGNVWRAV